MISLCFVHFRTLSLQHLDAAWFSLSKQDFTGVQEVCFLDNNTDDSPAAITAVLDRYPLPVPVFTRFAKHGDPTRTQSWSVNSVCQWAGGPWLFFTRSDYILAFDCLQKMRDQILLRPTWDHRRFVSGWCWQMGADEALTNAETFVDVERYGWRERGMMALLEHPYAPQHGGRCRSVVHEQGLPCRGRVDERGAGVVGLPAEHVSAGAPQCGDLVYDRARVPVRASASSCGARL